MEWFYTFFSKENLKELLNWLLHLVIAVAIGLFIITFVAQRTVVYNFSMEPTLHEGDNLLVEKISPRLGIIRRGDIVTIKNVLKEYDGEDKTIIKRVIAIGGDNIEIKNSKVFVNGEELKEDYINGSSTSPQDAKYSLMKVPDGFFYVLGDNRARPILDSRTIGPVKASDINGKAIFRFYPFNMIGKL